MIYKLFWLSQFFALGVLDALIVAVKAVSHVAVDYHHLTRK